MRPQNALDFELLAFEAVEASPKLVWAGCMGEGVGFEVGATLFGDGWLTAGFLGATRGGMCGTGAAAATALAQKVDVMAARKSPPNTNRTVLKSFKVFKR
jgi:hypothetical protein